MINHLHLSGWLVVVALVAATGGIGLVFHEVFHSRVQQDRGVDSSDDDLTPDREVNQP